jgi:hypothetical protein
MVSSYELASIYTIGFIIRLYLILLIGVQTYNVAETKVHSPSSKQAYTLRITAASKHYRSSMIQFFF